MTKDPPRWLRPTVDYGPLAVLGITYLLYDFMVATAAIMVAAALAVLLSLVVARRVPMMPLVTAVVIGVFGGLTLWLNDPRFFKMKPTIVQGLFSLILFAGLAFGKPLLKPLLGHAWPMDQAGWRKLTLRFAIFFVVMALHNEAVWRTQSEQFWVAFKIFGILGLTMVFAMAQAPMMQRHHLAEAAETKAERHVEQAEKEGN
ncbi:MAG: septation protein A [Rhodospirillales bacterium]|nr:septation protein A [Rhodospirillales bacterium]